MHQVNKKTHWPLFKIYIVLPQLFQSQFSVKLCRPRTTRKIHSKLRAVFHTMQCLTVVSKTEKISNAKIVQKIPDFNVRCTSGLFFCISWKSYHHFQISKRNLCRQLNPLNLFSNSCTVVKQVMIIHVLTAHNCESKLPFILSLLHNTELHFT